MKQSYIKDFAQEIAFEIAQLEEAKQEIIKIRDDLIRASFSVTQACKKIAEAFNLDYRTLQKWLNSNGPLNSKNRLEVMLFLDTYKEYRKELDSVRTQKGDK
tara:strand:+ start:412 stop:717 length:306 start_codon:yes stop_codon:yes gene_type:complete